MKLIGSFLALIAVLCAFTYFADTSVASTASVTYHAPVGMGVSVSPPTYSFTKSGTYFDLQLCVASVGFGSPIENRTNVADQDIGSSGIQVQSTLGSNLQSNTEYSWRVKEIGEDDWEAPQSFTTGN
jgi:hypothetical protein